MSTLILITVLLMSCETYSSTEFVFFEFHNETGISSVGYVALIGLLTISFSFSGYESGASLAEETKSASSSAPKGIVMACIMAAIVGFIYVIGLLYAMQENIDFALNGSVSSMAACNIFYIAFT
jgi:amino acid transporter